MIYVFFSHFCSRNLVGDPSRVWEKYIFFNVLEPENCFFLFFERA